LAWGRSFSKRAAKVRKSYETSKSASLEFAIVQANNDFCEKKTRECLAFLIIVNTFAALS
jgi:hypothetical protein